MNMNNYYGYCFRFKRKTKLDLWTAVNKEWLSIWYYFETQDDLIELARNNDEEFIALYNKMERKLSSKTDKINDQYIIFAIAVSLYNTHFDTKRIRTRDTYFSKKYVSQDTAREILWTYWQNMANPLALVLDPDRMYMSLIRWKELSQINTFSKNGINNPGRITWALATPQQYNQLFIESVQVELYHPTVWYLLKEQELQEYSHLFTKAKELCQKWIWSSTQKHPKMQDE